MADGKISILDQEVRGSGRSTCPRPYPARRAEFGRSMTHRAGQDTIREPLLPAPVTVVVGPVRRAMAMVMDGSEITQIRERLSALDAERASLESRLAKL